MNNLKQSVVACPSCGHDGFNQEEQCSCGYQADESFMIESFIMKSDQKDTKLTNEKSLKNVVKPQKGKPANEVVIKEIDSWIISFSPADNSISLGTPALQSFRLKLQLHDIEELLDILYHMTGQEKTTRKLSLSSDEINELLKRMYNMIEEKKSKIAIKFSENELQSMADMINTKLKTEI
jgi:ribosomal protein L37E